MLRFWEIPSSQNSGTLISFDITWAAQAFRPLEEIETDISELKGLLNTTGKELVESDA